MWVLNIDLRGKSVKTSKGVPPQISITIYLSDNYDYLAILSRAQKLWGHVPDGICISCWGFWVLMFNRQSKSMRHNAQQQKITRKSRRKYETKKSLRISSDLTGTQKAASVLCNKQLNKIATPNNNTRCLVTMVTVIITCSSFHNFSGCGGSDYFR